MTLVEHHALYRAGGAEAALAYAASVQPPAPAAPPPAAEAGVAANGPAATTELLHHIDEADTSLGAWGGVIGTFREGGEATVGTLRRQAALECIAMARYASFLGASFKELNGLYSEAGLICDELQELREEIAAVRGPVSELDATLRKLQNTRGDLKRRSAAALETYDAEQASFDTEVERDNKYLAEHPDDQQYHMIAHETRTDPKRNLAIHEADVLARGLSTALVRTELAIQQTTRQADEPADTYNQVIEHITRGTARFGEIQLRVTAIEQALAARDLTSFLAEQSRRGIDQIPDRALLRDVLRLFAYFRPTEHEPTPADQPAATGLAEIAGTLTAGHGTDDDSMPATADENQGGYEL